MDILREVSKKLVEANDLPEFSAGDTVIVSYKIKEGSKERIQQFQGIVIQKEGFWNERDFLPLEKFSGGIGVERIFPLNSPFIDDVKITKKGRVRRARIFYQRERTGKSARIKEKKRFVKKA